MPWAVCQHSREKINEAGRLLITLRPDDPQRESALEVIKNWRAAHAYPLNAVKLTLANRARANVNANALVVQRLKRLSSMALKLRHNPSMRLSQMQDIGGCRAVLNSAAEVAKLVRVYERAMDRHKRRDDRAFVWRKDDYILQPKLDGYRGVHLIMKYQSLDRKEYNEQKIEIQIRSKLQHAWATAVETCQTFTGQALKSRIKSASETWLRFFVLMSSAIAARERRPPVPGTPERKDDRKRELAALESSERIISLLEGWRTAMSHDVVAYNRRYMAFMMELDAVKKSLRITPFMDVEAANDTYLMREVATETDPNVQVVLVSADSVAALQRAYPNYYVDTAAFIEAIKQEIY